VAFLIPEQLRSRRDVSPGVARFAAALRDGLDDDVTVWYEPAFDLLGKRPALVVLHPSEGILLLEVLISRAAAVRPSTSGTLVLADGEGERDMPNPLARAEEYAARLDELIRRDGRLHPDDRLPVAAAAVLPYISEEAATARGLGQALPRHRCLYREDVDAGAAGAVEFRRRIAQLLGAPLRDRLSPEAENVYRALIHPDTVIGTHQLPFPSLLPAGDDLVVLDRQQEALAKSLGVGHRVIRGPAGSGKTLVLVYRARLLAETFPHHRVLVTCFNRPLAGRLRQQLKSWKNVTVDTLDALMASARRAAEMDVVDLSKHSREELAERALRAFDSCPEQVPRFDHVLIDEAQDFPTPALQFAVRLLVEGSDSLLAVADPLQNIYRTKFTWKAAGINAAGRTKWLHQSYRNTKEILEYAHNFVTRGGDYVVSDDPDPEDALSISAPRFSPRSGPVPLILHASSPAAEVLQMAAHCRQLLDKGTAPGDVAVLYGSAWAGHFGWPSAIQRVFADHGIPTLWANDPGHPNRRDHIDDDRTQVLVSTIHAAKGLEFRHVLLCGYLDDKPPDQNRVSRTLVYVGMTRATYELVLSASGHHPYLADLERS